MDKPERVAILGASTNPARMANKALKRLAAEGHEPIPVNPQYEEVEGRKAYPDLEAVPGTVDTVTVYLSPERVIPYIPQIIAIRPARVIMNPGAESEILEEAMWNAKIQCTRACTLVLLSTKQF